MGSSRSRLLTFVAAILVVVAMPVASAAAAGPVATGSAAKGKGKSKAAKELQLLKLQTAGLTKLAGKLTRKVIKLDEKTAALEGRGPRTSIPPGGPAEGSFVGTFPAPQLAPETVGPIELASGAVQSPDIADGGVDFFNIGIGVIGPRHIAGRIPAGELNGADLVTNLGNFIVQPGETRSVEVECPEGWRVLSGGFEWASTDRDDLEVLSSGPSFEFPNKRFGVQARVEPDGQQNVIFVDALCLEA